MNSLQMINEDIAALIDLNLIFSFYLISSEEFLQNQFDLFEGVLDI